MKKFLNIALHLVDVLKFNISKYTCFMNMY